MYAPSLRPDDIIENVKKGFDVDKVAFLINETRNFIDLASSFMFTPQNCYKHQLVSINRFNRLTSKWESDKFFPRKYKNLHNCTLTVEVPRRVTN